MPKPGNPVITNDNGNTPVRGQLSVWGNVGTSGDDITPASRWMGDHDGSAPTIGAFKAGDWVTDKTTPAIWICTVGGTPGTWTSLGGGYVSGDLHVTGSLTVDDDASTNDLTGTTTINGDLGVAGSTQLDGTTVINGDTTINGTVHITDAVQVNATTTLVGELDVTGGDLVMSAGGVKTLASSTSSAGLNLPHGAAPTSPVNGDMWTTTAGLFVRINGVTVGPLS